jgi:AcrR family transcriptional regulator
MMASANLYLTGQHLSVGGIATESGISRVTINLHFKDERGKPTVKIIEDRIIATVLGDTRAAIFDYLRHQDPVVSENPLYQLIAVFRAILH